MSKNPLTIPPEGVPHGSTEYRVIYGDTDLAGHIYYGNYPRLFEMGRTALLRQIGGDYASWERDHGVMLPVRECHLEYHSPALYDELLTIRTWLAHATEVQVHFVYRIERDGTLLTSGYTRQVFVDLQTRRPVRAGRRLLEPLGIWPGAAAPTAGA